MCVPPGILCAPNKMTSLQMGWLECSHRSGSEREDLKGVSDGGMNHWILYPLPWEPSEEEQSISTGGFSPKQPRGFIGHWKWLLNTAWPEFPKGQLQRVHLPCTWFLPGLVRSAKVKFLLSPAQKCKVGEKGEQLLYPCSVFTASKCS